MPELPEIEVIKDELKKYILNATIEDIYINDAAVVTKRHQHGELESLLANRTVTDIQRKGKYLILILDNDGRFVIHLSLSGKIARVPMPDTVFHCRFNNKENLLISDKNAYAKLFYVSPKDKEPAELTKLGPDALSEDATDEYIINSLKTRKMGIKAALLNQTILAGIGNTYSDEILFHTKLSPLTKCNTIPVDKLRELAYDIENTLSVAIIENKIYIDMYLNNALFDFHDIKKYQVYRREHLPCPNCRTKIATMILNNRKYHYCPKCQPCPTTGRKDP